MQDAPMSRARYMQENRKMRFEEAFEGWSQGRLTQGEAALLLGQCERSFRRHIERYKADGLDGLLDKRLSQISRRRASGVEVDQVVQLYKSGFAGWNVAHFHSKYKAEFAGSRSYSWLKSVLQGAGVVKVAKRRGRHRIKREGIAHRLQQVLQQIHAGEGEKLLHRRVKTLLAVLRADAPGGIADFVENARPVKTDHAGASHVLRNLLERVLRQRLRVQQNHVAVALFSQSDKRL